MALNKRERVLLSTTITLIVLGVNYLLLVPLTHRWGSLREQLSSKRRELKEDEAFIQRAPQWQKEYDELRGKANQQSVRFQQASDVSKKIEELRSASGILIKDTRTMSIVERDVYRELPVQCNNIEATAETLVKFLYAVQTSPEFMSIEELTVTPQPDNPRLLRCTIRLQALMGKSEGAKS